MKHRRIIIIGFKSSGKTTIGKALAEKKGWTFLDLDNLIEEKYAETNGEKATCREITIHNGAVYFRNLETQVLEEVLAQEGKMVLAMGGGTPLIKENQDLLKGELIVQISENKEKIVQRIIAENNGELKSEQQDKIEKLLVEREPLYRGFATVVVENNESVDAVVERVVAEVEKF